MSEYRVHYLEPGLGWCVYIYPHPQGNLYDTEEKGRAAAEECRQRLNREVKLLECGAAGIREIDLGNQEPPKPPSCPQCGSQCGSEETMERMSCDGPCVFQCLTCSYRFVGKWARK